MRPAEHVVTGNVLNERRFIVDDALLLPGCCFAAGAWSFAYEAPILRRAVRDAAACSILFCFDHG